MSEEQQPEANQTASSKNLGGAKRRRGRRGGRGRGPRPPEKLNVAEPPPVDEAAAMVEVPTAPVENASANPPRPVIPPRPRFQPAAPQPRIPRPDGSAISRAVNEVMQVIESLQETLEQMEEVLELVEHAERQKITDEREIESLLRALRQFQSRGERAARPEPPERQERFNRPNRRSQTIRRRRTIDRLLQHVFYFSRIAGRRLAGVTGAEINQRAVFRGQGFGEFLDDAGITQNNFVRLIN